jgi:hypothetical protein
MGWKRRWKSKILEGTCRTGKGKACEDTQHVAVQSSLCKHHRSWTRVLVAVLLVSLLIVGAWTGMSLARNHSSLSRDSTGTATHLHDALAPAPTGNEYFRGSRKGQKSSVHAGCDNGSHAVLCTASSIVRT